MGANVTATGGRAIVTNSGNNATINIAAAATVKGLGDATAALFGTGTATHAVIDVTTVTGAVTAINNAGLITSINGAPTIAIPTPSAYADLALKAAVGGVTLNNANTFLGRIQAGGVTAANSVTVNNTSAGAVAANWHTTGTSTLGAGNDAINNNGAAANVGLIATNATGAATTIDFGAGADTLNNGVNGVIVAGEIQGAGVTAASTLTLSNLETFTNNGRIVFGSNSAQVATGQTAASFLSDGGSAASHADAGGGINDKILAVGAVFGGTTGTLVMDANLWSDVQANCGALTAADCLQVGSTTGTTNQAILINDNNAHALGAYNPNGIAIVVGSSAASAFHLDPGSEWFVTGGTPQYGGATNVLDKPGLFFYDLAFDAATNRELLISAPKQTAFQFAQIGAVASDTWYTTTQTWFDRQADLRDTINGRANGGAPGVWMKIVGDWSRRSSTDTLTLFNKTYTFNTGYNADTTAIIGGIDFLSQTDKDKAWVLGVQGGYVDTNVRFKASATRTNLTGGSVGVYGSFVSGGLFVDGVINGNFLRAEWSLPGFIVNPNLFQASGDVTTWGGRVEAGYQMPLGASSFWEPVGSLSYGRSSFDNLAMPGGAGNFLSTNNGDTFRGDLGLRIGTTAAYQYYKVKLALEGRVGDEFDGKTTTNLVIPGGPNFINTNDISGVYGEVKGEANLFAMGNNLSAFLNAGVKWKTHYQDSTITLGFRYQW